MNTLRLAGLTGGLLLLLLAASPASAADPSPGDPVRVTLVGGTLVDGILISMDEQTVVLEMDGDEFTLRRSQVEAVEAAPAAAPATTAPSWEEPAESEGFETVDDGSAASGVGPEDTRERWILRAGSVGLSPRFSPWGGSELNEDLIVGLTVDVWLAEWIGIEANVSFFPRGIGNDNNSRSLAAAVLRLLTDDSFRLEAVERHLAWTVSAVFLPFWGHLGPPGAPGAAVDFVVALGGGMEFDAIEMLELDRTYGELGSAVAAASPQAYTRPVVNLAFGSRLWVLPQLGFRVEGRLLGGPVTVLNHDTQEALQHNARLGPTVNRLDCGGSFDDGPICKTAWEGSFTVEFGVDFGLGVRRGGGS